MAESKEKNIIKGEPTKELFITMLIKDITLRDAIGDLVDNSVDAARKVAKNKNDLSKFSINIKISKDKFEIIDDCGGLEVKIAKNFAFCFGKPAGYTP